LPCPVRELDNDRLQSEHCLQVSACRGAAGLEAGGRHGDHATRLVVGPDQALRAARSLQREPIEQAGTGLPVELVESLRVYAGCRAQLRNRLRRDAGLRGEVRERRFELGIGTGHPWPPWISSTCRWISRKRAPALRP